MSETATAMHAPGMKEESKKRPYVIVFVVLAVVTLVELSINSLGLPHLEAILILVVLATVKGSLVVAYYMHLRYEPRWIALIPLAGLALVAVLVAALTATVAHS
jgi:caa(3)-type oxidase subunit IV